MNNAQLSKALKDHAKDSKKEIADLKALVNTLGKAVVTLKDDMDQTQKSLSQVITLLDELLQEENKTEEKLKPKEQKKPQSKQLETESEKDESNVKLEEFQ